MTVRTQRLAEIRKRLQVRRADQLATVFPSKLILAILDDADVLCAMIDEAYEDCRRAVVNDQTTAHALQAAFAELQRTNSPWLETVEGKAAWSCAVISGRPLSEEDEAWALRVWQDLQGPPKYKVVQTERFRDEATALGFDTSSIPLEKGATDT